MIGMLIIIGNILTILLLGIIASIQDIKDSNFDYYDYIIKQINKRIIQEENVSKPLAEE